MSELGDKLRALASHCDADTTIRGVAIVVVDALSYEVFCFDEDVDLESAIGGLNKIMTDIVENNPANILECISSSLN